jgi:uncharacterized surface protein with fasciclin (FAS1) repeats
MADLLETAIQAGNFSTLLKAVEVAGLRDLLQAEGSFTLMAPTDAAFEDLPEGHLEELLQDVPRLKRVVSYHMLSGDVRSDDLLQIDEAPTIEGSIMAIEHDANGIEVNDVKVRQTDILADNGVIHVIDGVLIPALLGEL